MGSYKLSNKHIVILASTFVFISLNSAFGGGVGEKRTRVGTSDDEEYQTPTKKRTQSSNNKNETPVLSLEEVALETAVNDLSKKADEMGITEVMALVSNFYFEFPENKTFMQLLLRLSKKKDMRLYKRLFFAFLADTLRKYDDLFENHIVYSTAMAEFQLVLGDSWNKGHSGYPHSEIGKFLINFAKLKNTEMIKLFVGIPSIRLRLTNEDRDMAIFLLGKDSEISSFLGKSINKGLGDTSYRIPSRYLLDIYMK